MRSALIRYTGLAALTVVVAAPLRAEWEPPRDNRFTEKQLVTYIECLKDVMDQWKAMGKKVEGADNVAAIAALGQVDEKLDAVLAKHGTQRKEFEWMGGQVAMSYGMAVASDAMAKMKLEYEEQGKKAQQDLIDAQKKLAGYEAARKEGRRFMNKEDREIAIKEAREQQQSFVEDMKQQTELVKQVAEEIAKHDADAKAAETQAKNVPAGLADADREEYVKGKMAEADSARTDAKDARDRETEAKKILAESKAKVDLTARRMANPEIPISDDEKATAKQENEEGIKACKDEIEKVTSGIEAMKNAKEQLAKMTADQEKEVPAANIELMKKHLQEFTAAWAVEEKK